MSVSIRPTSTTVANLAAGKSPAPLHFFEWNLSFGSLHDPALVLCLAGLLLSGVLLSLRIKGALLIGIIVTTLMGIPAGVTVLPEHFNPFQVPSFSHLAVGALDIPSALKLGISTVIFTFTFIELFDAFGTLVGTFKKAGLADQEGSARLYGRAMLVDAFGVSFGAFMGTSTVTAYIESAAGISAGGRTGLTSVSTGLFFLAALFFAPLARLVPDAATAPALIMVGMMMISFVKEIDFSDFTEGMPAFLTFIFMPLTYGIANGISAGIVSYTLLKLCTGKARQIHWLMYILTALIFLRYIFKG